MLWPVIVASVVMFAAAVVMADAGAASTPPTPPQNLAALWPMIGVALASLAAYGVRQVSAKYTFFHSGVGAGVLTLLGSIISAVTPVIQAHGFAWAALAWAAVGAVTSFTATLNPSVPLGTPAPSSPLARQLAVPPIPAAGGK